MILQRIKKIFRSIPAHFKKFKVKVVHDEDLQELLESLDIASQINAGDSNCIVCAEKITKENLGGMLKKNGNIYVFCNKPRCLTNYSQ